MKQTILHAVFFRCWCSGCHRRGVSGLGWRLCHRRLGCDITRHRFGSKYRFSIMHFGLHWRLCHWRLRCDITWNRFGCKYRFSIMLSGRRWRLVTRRRVNRLLSGPLRWLLRQLGFRRGSDGKQRFTGSVVDQIIHRREIKRGGCIDRESRRRRIWLRRLITLLLLIGKLASQRCLFTCFFFLFFSLGLILFAVTLLLLFLPGIAQFRFLCRIFYGIRGRFCRWLTLLFLFSFLFCHAL